MTKPELLEEQSSIANTDIIMATNSSNVTKKITGQNVKMDLGAVNVALICSTAAATAEKVVTGPSITLAIGVTFKVIFSNGNSASSPSINYNSVGALSLKIYSGGSKIAPSLSQMQAGTMLEVYFDGSDFVIMGNPIVYSSSDYTIYADGQTNKLKITNGATLSTNSTYDISQRKVIYVDAIDSDSQIFGLGIADVTNVTIGVNFYLTTPNSAGTVIGAILRKTDSNTLLIVALLHCTNITISQVY